MLTSILLLIYVQIVTLIHATSFDTSSHNKYNWTFRCPCVCDYDDFGRKRIDCQYASFKSIPISEMDASAQVRNVNSSPAPNLTLIAVFFCILTNETLVISGSPQKPIELTLGTLFQQFIYLQEISITYASIRAIGASSFWPGTALTKLSLSNNKLTFLSRDDFNGLSVLQELDLSHNEITSQGWVSASLTKLTSLTKLSLAHNKITELPPRAFMLVSKLEVLDLSHNNLDKLESTALKDTPSLKQLHLVGCNLQYIHSLVYQRLPQLEVLDLRNNRISSLAPHEFKYLPRLRVLNLDENHLTSVQDHTFNALNLQTLGLSRNYIDKFEDSSFSNCTVKRLDISHNKMTHLSSNLFKPLRTSLSTLNIAHNRHLVNASQSIHQSLRNLVNVNILSLSSTGVDDSLPHDVFYYQRKNLVSLDLSGNDITNVSAKWFNNFTSLRQLDLSYNQITRVSKAFLKRIDSIKTLKQIFLHQNAWSCYRCHVVPLVDWIHSNPAPYREVCKDEDDTFCVKCSIPSDLAGKNLHTINEIKLEWCTDPNVQQRTLASQPRIGLVLAILIIISICAIIVVIIILYRKKQSATYYTREEEPCEHNIFTIERLMSTDAYNELIRKSFDGNSLLQHNNCTPPAVPFSPAQDTLSPASLSPPMSPLSPVNRKVNRASPSRSLSQSLSSIPAPPPLPPPDLPSASSPPPLSPSAVTIPKHVEAIATSHTNEL